MMWRNLVPKTILILILILASGLRLYGLNWDQNQHLHPDERFLTMVSTGLKWPTNISQYLDTDSSTLNPHNLGFGFYVYGTWPVIFVRWVAENIKLNDYVNLTLVGRFLSATADICVVVAVYFLAFALTRKREIASLSSLWYSLSVLPIQLAHFYTTDPYVTLFAVLAILTAVKSFQSKFSFIANVLCGICLGLAISAKISVGILLPIICTLLFVGGIRERRIFKSVLSIATLAVVAFVVVRLAYPYLFDGWGLNLLVLNNWRELSSYNTSQAQFPPAIMWITTKPYLFPLQNIVLWGLGVPLASLTCLGLIWTIFNSRRNFLLWFIILPVVVIFGYQGYQYAKNMRYLYVIYPFFAIMAGMTWEAIGRTKWFKPLLVGAVISVIIWPISFLSIYSRPHSRVTASQWIYQNIPVGSTISCEAWDDCLPLNLESYPGNGAYKGSQLSMFDPDSEKKWQEISDKLFLLDYIILSSNRVYGSTMTVPDRYPGNVNFYSLLFNGELGFAKIAEFTSRPNLPAPGYRRCILFGSDFYGKIARASETCSDQGISILDDYSEETFTVYDHPKVIIFKKIFPVDYSSLLVKSDYFVN